VTQEQTSQCKHGPFNLLAGCPQCIAEYRLTDQEPDTNIVKVLYFSETTQELSSREYTYYSEALLKVDDIVTVPVRDTFAKAKVSAINVPVAEIASFKDKVKTIPVEAKRRASGIEPQNDEMEDGLNVEGLTLFMESNDNAPYLPDAHDDLQPEAITLAIVKPEADETVMSFYAEGRQLLRYAEARTIATVDDLIPANDDLIIIRKVKKGMEEKRKEYLKPFQDHVKDTNEAYKSLMEPIEQADIITSGKMLAFNADQKRQRREQENINRLRMEAAQKEMELKGELTESVDLVEVQPEAPKTVHTDIGSAGMRDAWKWEVVDFAAVPDAYKVIDSSQLSAIAKKHHDQKPIPGVHFYNEPIIQVTNRR